MKNLLFYRLFFIVVGLTLLPLTLEAKSYRSNLKNAAKAAMEDYSPAMNKLKGGGKICSVGIQSTWKYLIITRVSDSGSSKGFKPGDKMVKIDGKSLTSANRQQIMSLYTAGDALTVSVERSGTVLDLEMVCDDGTDITKAFHGMLEAAAKGRWQECIDQSYKADQLNGDAISFSAGYRQFCSEAIRCSSRTCKEPTIQASSLLYDFERLKIEEAVIADGLDDIRSGVLANISWLEQYGSHKFARELQARLSEADSGLRPKIAKHTTPHQPTTAFGTCFAVSGSEVLTSQHVVANANLITVEFQDGVDRLAVVSEQSQSTDLALLKTSGEIPEFLPLAPMRTLEVGQEVFTLGFPVTSILGSDVKFTEGSVSALSGIQGDASYFQMSVPIQPGNSGGPVVNMQGEVVGVVASTAAIEAFYTVSGSLPQNINWAAKADYARILFNAPTAERKAKTRSEAIEMAKSAICKVKAVMN